MNLLLYRHFFPSFEGKIYPRVVWFAEWIYRNASEYSYLASPFHQRDIDILFIASNWRRPEKNYPWVKTVAARQQISKFMLSAQRRKIFLKLSIMAP